jgi:putative glutamine amidotransferase
MRPAIGITIACDAPRRGYLGLHRDYLRAVEQAGGLPLVLAPGTPADAPDLVARLDGLLLSGGSDVDPTLYGAAPHPKLGRVFRERDDFELALAREALTRDLPLLCICRGHQVLNVARGGTLVQDLPSQRPGPVEHGARAAASRRVHAVDVRPGTRLHALLGREQVLVNSSHHQAIDALGEGLSISATAPDGVIEGVELGAARFALGVQWHPEAFWRRRDGFQALFAALVGAGARV